ncbi:MAG: hypothetical protein KAI29_10860, partial [Cyclobacteriaceae bacterium]|nr:hypothetical protein [Cyclobacteriaceae bacterium]
GVLKIEWNGKSLDIENSGEKNIEVPALNKFEIIEAKVIQKPGQHIQIRFSDILLKNQDLTGLVELESVSNLRLEIDGNVINGWPDKAISGELNLTVYEGVKNANYFKLKEPEMFLLQFSSPNPEIRLIGKGVIVPQSNALKMPFEAVGLNAVDVRVIQIFKENIIQFFQDILFSHGFI